MTSATLPAWRSATSTRTPESSPASAPAATHSCTASASTGSASAADSTRAVVPGPAGSAAVSARSLSRMVTVAEPSPTVALVKDVTFTENVSVSSFTRSPMTGMVKVRLVTPGAKVSTLVTAP